MASYDWIIGLMLIFALAFLMSYYTYRDLESFFFWCTIFSGFMVWGGVIELWYSVVFLIITFTLIFISIQRGESI